MSGNGQQKTISLTVGDYWYCFAVYALYAAFLIPSINPEYHVGLREALSFLTGIHFILMVGFLFFLDRHEKYFWEDQALSRYGSFRACSAARKRLLIRESLLFWGPFLILETAGGILDGQNVFLYAGACLNFLIMAIIAGYVSCFLSEIWKGRHWGVLLLAGILTLDYVQAYGWLFPCDGSLFYWPAVMPFMELTAVTVFRGCSLSLLILLFLFLFCRDKGVYSQKRLSIWRIPVRELFVASGMGILLALSCVKEAQKTEELWILLLGMGGRNNDLNLFGTIFDLMPFLILFLVYGSRLSIQIESAAVLIFPRSGSRDRWWRGQYLRLCGQVLAFFCVMLIAGFVTGIAFGIIPANWHHVLTIAGSLLLCWGGSAMILVLGMNICSMRRDRRGAFLLASGLLSIGYLVDFAKNTVSGILAKRVILPARASILIHGESLAAQWETDLFARAVPGLTVWETVFLFLLCLTVLYRVGLQRLQTMDYM